MLGTILFASILCTGCPTGNSSNSIDLNDDAILYNGKTISAESSNAVYCSTFTESHEDVANQYKDTANMPQPPQSGFNTNSPLTADFVIDSENRVYAGITPLETASTILK